MRKISIIIILCIIGCAGTKGKKKVIKGQYQKSEIKIYYQHWNVSEDSLNLFLHMELPLNQFVFKKSSDHFYSNVTYTLVISHTEKNIQVYRESWDEKVIQSFYDDTRNPDNYFTTERNITLTPGTFKLFLNVQDKDSRRNWQLNEEYELKLVHNMGAILPFINNENLEKIVAINIIGKIDTIWLRTQVNLPDKKPDTPVVTDVIDHAELMKEKDYDTKSDYRANLNINYTVIRKETVIDSGTVNVTGKGINHLYYLPIPMTQHKRGRYAIELSCLGEKKTTSFSYGIKGKHFWTDDLDEVVGVMQYILSNYSEYIILKNMNESSQWDYIHEYWKEIDPSPETNNNELLIQLNNRVKYVNNNFSIFMSGWRSDRGRIYIINGPPQYVDKAYQDQRGYTYQKWVYSSGKQFIFIDRSMSGDYSLYREVY